MKIDSREMILQSVGSTPLYDAVFLFVLPPLGLLSLAGNLLSYFIFSARYFKKKPYYTYLRAYCLNSSMMNFIFAISFICDSRRFLDLSNTELSTYFRCYIKIFLSNTYYFYGSVLDIVLAIDRLIEFSSLKMKFRQHDPNRVCSFLFVLVLFLNVPFLFIFEPKKRLIIYDDNFSRNQTEGEEFFYYGESQFALSPQGIILKNIQYFIRDILTLVLLVVINFITLILFRKKYKKKSDRNDRKTATKTGQRKISRRSKQSGTIRRSTSVEVIRSSINKNNKNMSLAQVNAMLTKMVFIISAFALCEHLFLTLSLQMFTDFLRPIKIDIIFFANISMFLNHSINFFIFYSFNSFFKRRLKRLLSKNN